MGRLRTFRLGFRVCLTAVALVALFLFSQAIALALAPTTTLTLAPATADGDDGWFRTVPVITLKADTTATVYYSWDGVAAGTAYTGPFKAPEGVHTLNYYSVSSGGETETVANRQIKVDTLPPLLRLNAPAHRRHVRGILKMGVTTSDSDVSVLSSGVSDLKLYGGGRLLGAGMSSLSSFQVNTRTLRPGRRIFKVVVRDKAGNVTKVYRHYFIDNTAPKVPVIYAASGALNAGMDGRFFYEVRDKVAPRVYVTAQIRRPNGMLLSRADLGRRRKENLMAVDLRMPAEEGDFIFRLIARDYAGNRRIKVVKFTVVNNWELANVKKHLFELSKNIGIRVEGTDGEHRAADYIESRLKEYGYTVERQAFSLPDGKTSYNVVARKPGSDPGRQFIVGAHYDSKAPAPGANDNGSGSAVLLELARMIKTKKLKSDLVFVWFGAEERFGANRYPEHQGSRYFVAGMSGADRQRTIGMISVDMVGYGRTFHVRSMRRGPMSLVNDLLGFAGANNYAATFAQDFGWSDHDSFELVGIPAAWLEWRNDNLFHTPGDVYERIQWDRVDTTGRFLSGYLLDRLKR